MNTRLNIYFNLFYIFVKLFLRIFTINFNIGTYRFRIFSNKIYFNEFGANCLNFGEDAIKFSAKL